ncbi:GNAT family N-acetyltransferase [Nonomuraea sediminis]|uniref:GNAT family N-acetyltransferase n=1 Tax=Nonomuraea sediminis TaxID=2835864 RepID=UPI001BDD6526|nr:GNAT family N-acetyltransferase [Nonomuraea sediminis]
MPELMLPTVVVHESFVAAAREFHAHPEPPPWFVAGLDPGELAASDAFERYVTRLLAEPLESTPRPEGFVPATTLWWIDGQEFLGRLAVRHRLTPALEDAGGHIGYDVRPSARNRGHATAMLREALPVAHRLGIDPALLTCDDTNLASRRVIERNGGRYIGSRGVKQRFLVPTT